MRHTKLYRMDVDVGLHHCRAHKACPCDLGLYGSAAQRMANPQCKQPCGEVNW